MEDNGEVLSVIQPSESVSTASHPTWVNKLLSHVAGFGSGDRKELSDSVRENWKSIRSRYGIDVDMHRLAPDEKAEMAALDKLNLREAEKALRIIREELGKYPPVFIQQLDLQEFRVLKDIHHRNHHQIGGLAYKDGTTYITSGSSELFDRQVIHHELFHQRDYDHSQFKMRRARIPLLDVLLGNRYDETLDRDWAELNPEGSAVYVGDQWRAYHQAYAGGRPAGFARTYGLKNEWEDRATIAERLMTEPNQLFDTAHDDEVLREKTFRIMKLYSESTKGLMNKDYFEALGNGDIGEAYWNEHSSFK